MGPWSPAAAQPALGRAPRRAPASRRRAGVDPPPGSPAAGRDAAPPGAAPGPRARPRTCRTEPLIPRGTIRVRLDATAELEQLDVETAEGVAGPADPHALNDREGVARPPGHAGGPDGGPEREPCRRAQFQDLHAT